MYARRSRVGGRRLATAAGTCVLLAGALGYVGLADPHDTGSAYPLCPFKWLTGWNCPFCGGLRMTHDLLHADMAAAVNDNVFVLLGLPLLGVWVLARRRNGMAPAPPAATLTIALAALVWTVVRNLPGFPLVPVIQGG
ncbi:hypothetical protein MPRM_17120 [Mycobacterium parmense]|uniref:DUF2752 domain-containing protein n=1 Tax=Mycobacterium parmense TaxID=185642 RepID=A0A7I7YUK8_9MYCO|nr:hypothetical protein MPRM_17120 [Mycobacterium parmense]